MAISLGIYPIQGFLGDLGWSSETKKWAISLMKNGFEDALTTRKLKQPDVVNVDMRMTKDQVFWDRNAPD